MEAADELTLKTSTTGRTGKTAGIPVHAPKPDEQPGAASATKSEDRPARGPRPIHVGRLSIARLLRWRAGPADQVDRSGHPPPGRRSSCSKRRFSNSAFGAGARRSSLRSSKRSPLRGVPRSCSGLRARTKGIQLRGGSRLPLGIGWPVAIDGSCTAAILSVRGINAGGGEAAARRSLASITSGLIWVASKASLGET